MNLSFQIQLRNTLTKEQYGAYLKTFLQYKNNSSYEAFRDSLFTIFKEKRFFYILKGMVRFTMSEHRPRFQKDVQELIKANS